MEEVEFDIDVDECSIQHTLNQLKRKYTITKRNWFESTGAGLPDDSPYMTIEGYIFFASFF